MKHFTEPREKYGAFDELEIDFSVSRMPVHLAQYRVKVGIFNNQNIRRNLKFEEFPIWKCSKNLFKVFLTLQIFDFLFSSDYNFKLSTLSRNFIQKLLFLKDNRKKMRL